MTAPPRVTIVTPSYNQGAYIAETIESVLAQDYADLEYIIADGGSTDETLDVIHRYENDPRLSWFSEPDEGFADALNRGFTRSSGAIMGWLNSDDVFIGQPVRASVDYLQANPSVDLVYGDAVYVDAEGQPTGERQMGSPFDFVFTLSYLNSVPQPGTFWRRTLWDRIGPIRNDLNYMVDGEYWLRAANAGATLHYLPGDRATYRLHENSKTVSQSLQAAQEREQIAQEMLNDPAKYPLVAANSRLVRSNLAFQMALLYQRLGKREQAQRSSWEALRFSPLRRRWPAIAALYLDLQLGTSLLPALRRRWQRFKGET